MNRPRLLDLFCGAGGAGEGYRRAGFTVYGVDIEPHDYPCGDFLLADALAVLDQLLAGHGVTFTHPDGRTERLTLADFDAIHASPPCQLFTAYRRRGAGVGDGYLNLIPETRDALLQIELPYVIENVEDAPLQDAFKLCGSSFGLDVRRHRYFETSSPVMLIPPCEHGWQTPRFAPASNRTHLRRTVEVGVYRIPLAVQRAAMGIDWMSLDDLTEAIPPAYTEWIGAQLLEHLQVAA